jgi:hypothetical protein
MTYKEKLKDPRWQRKRLEIFQRDNFTCVCCGDKTTELHIHHIKYFAGFNPWEYSNELMKTLCKTCHGKEHFLIPEVEIERRYEHLLIYENEPDVITSINHQIGQLQLKLQENISIELMEEVLKNIIFLQTKKNELK